MTYIPSPSKQLHNQASFISCSTTNDLYLVHWRFFIYLYQHKSFIAENTVLSSSSDDGLSPIEGHMLLILGIPSLRLPVFNQCSLYSCPRSICSHSQSQHWRRDGLPELAPRGLLSHVLGGSIGLVHVVYDTTCHLAPQSTLSKVLDHIRHLDHASVWRCFDRCVYSGSEAFLNSFCKVPPRKLKISASVLHRENHIMFKITKTLFTLHDKSSGKFKGIAWPSKKSLKYSCSRSSS